MTVAEARSQTSGLGLNLEVDNRYYSSDVAPGHILTQSPPPGTVVRREWRVRVAESLGPQKVEVPDTVGADERVAALKLRRVGLSVGATAHMPYAGTEEGTVLAQDTPDGFVMPDFTGVPVVAAQTTLARVGLTGPPPTFVDVHVPDIGGANTAPKPPITPGSVIAQQPPPGARVDQNTAVKLTVAK
jgi:beta-lactam-binding protein with PASTA domain